VTDKGIRDGFSVDVAKAVTRVMDLKLEIRLDTRQHATEALSNGAIDLLPMTLCANVSETLPTL